MRSRVRFTPAAPKKDRRAAIFFFNTVHGDQITPWPCRTRQDRLAPGSSVCCTVRTTDSRGICHDSFSGICRTDVRQVPQSSLMPAFAMTFAQRASSRLIWALNSSAVLPTGITASSTRLPVISADRVAAATSRDRRSITGCGVLERSDGAAWRGSPAPVRRLPRGNSSSTRATALKASRRCRRRD